MALNFDGTYTPRSNPPDANYPYGSFKNATTPITGTPVDDDWANDFLGFFQKLLNYAGITPSGVPDTILASDFFDAMVKRINALSQYLVDSGAADAYVVSGDPVYTAYFDGMKIRVKITNLNTGPSTINVDSLGAKSIVKDTSTVLAAGDLPAGAIIEMQYDGTNFQVVSVGRHKIQIRDISRNLVIQNNAGNPTYQIDVDADEIVLQDNGGNPFRVINVDLTGDITASDANGLDTGSEASNTWYYIWVISTGSTVAALLSTSSTAPTMPSGYTYKALMGAIYNDGTPDFITIYQRDKHVICAPTTIISAGVAGSYTSVDLSSVVPTTAIEARGNFSATTTASVNTAQGWIAPKSTGEGEKHCLITTVTSGTLAVWGAYVLTLIEQQTLYYKAGSNSEMNATVSGWTY